MWLDTLLALLQGWAPVFAQQRTYEGAIGLALALLCGLGRRTLTRALCFQGCQDRDWSAAYKLFNRSRWEPKALFAPVLRTALTAYCGLHYIVVALDDTRRETQRKKS